MAGTPKQQSRYRYCVYYLRRRLEDEQPDTYAAWWADAQREWDEKEQGE